MAWLFLIVSVVLMDLALSGDNAVVVAAAANTLPKERRDQAMFWGIGAAIALRILLTGVSGWLLGFKGVAILGGLALLWIAYKMGKAWLAGEADPDPKALNAKDLGPAVIAIVIADVSMSIDNIAAIAAMTRGHAAVMVFGLLISVAIMFVGAKLLSGLLEKYPWVHAVAAGLIALIGLHMLFAAFFAR